jgi:hypothetical protein
MISQPWIRKCPFRPTFIHLPKRDELSVKKRRKQRKHTGNKKSRDRRIVSDSEKNPEASLTRFERSGTTERINRQARLTVAQSLGVAERLEQRVGLQNLVLHARLRG